MEKKSNTQALKAFCFFVVVFCATMLALSFADKKEQTSNNMGTVVDKVETEIKTRAEEILEMQADINKKKGIEYDNKDVQYDKAGHVGKPFAFVGTAELADYYNYAFSDFEDTFFCVRVTPIAGDSWYLFYIRPAKEPKNQEIYDKLIASDKVNVYATAVIHESFYEDGQDNEANGLMLDILE